MTKPKTIIDARGIITRFGANVVHDGVSFSVKQGEIYGILGGSGSGKSTMLRQLILLQGNEGGEITVLGKNIRSLSADEAHWLRMQWGVLFQFGALFSSLNVLENVGAPLREYSQLPASLINSIARAKIEMVGLPRKACHLYPSELSGGMKKRAGLARALSMDPGLLFLDEPTSGLDPASAEAFDHLVMELKHMLGLTVVMVTHDLGTIHNALDRFVILQHKKALFEGTIDEAKQSHYQELRHFFKW